jgi:nucleoside-diphosphate-sugar epimerase
VNGALVEDAPLPPDIAELSSSEAFVSGSPPYGIALKRVSELLALDYGLPMYPPSADAPTDSRGQLRTVVVRLLTNFGPGYTSMLNPLARLIHAAVRQDSSIVRPLRPFVYLCYVKDTVEAIKLVALTPTLQHRIYNVGADIEVTGAEVVEAFVEAIPTMATSLEIPAPHAPAANPAHRFSSDRLKKELGFQAQYSLVQGIADYAEWLQSHEY